VAAGRCSRPTTWRWVGAAGQQRGGREVSTTGRLRRRGLRSSRALDHVATRGSAPGRPTRRGSWWCERDEAETEREREREATIGGGSDAECEKHLETARREERNCILQQRFQHPLEVKLSGIAIRVPNNRGKTPFSKNNKRRTNPQTANHTPRSHDPGWRRAHGPNNLSSPSSSQPRHPSRELPSRSSARRRTTKSLPRSRGSHPLGQISASLEGQSPPRANLRLARGADTPSGESPLRSKAPRPLGRFSASLEGVAPPQTIFCFTRGRPGLVTPAPTPPTKALNALICRGCPGQKRILATPAL
jgi:hypothetical protein